MDAGGRHGTEESVWSLATVTSSQENNFFFLHLTTPSFQGRNFIILFMGEKVINKRLWQVDRKVAIGCQSRRNKTKKNSLKYGKTSKSNLHILT